MPRLLTFRSLKLFALVVALLWAYWPTLGEVAARWSNDPQYSHGYFVPLFALALLWLRRGQVDLKDLQGSWWGTPVLSAGAVMLLASAHFYFDWLGTGSFLVSLAGLCLFLGGWRALWWSWPAIAFLLFMLPLPYRIEVALAHPLQRFATLTSTYLLQASGFPAFAEGNIIIMEDVRIGVVEACSGLSMLVTFFAISSAVALVLHRPPMDKVFLVLSALPIALFVNVLRITATGVLHRTVGSEVANAVFHDLAGWLMMPMALALLWIEIKLLGRLLISAEAGPTIPLDFSGPNLAAVALANQGMAKQSS